LLSQQIVNAAVLGSEYALIAVGFTLYFGILNLINLSHGAVYMAGAFAALTIYRAGLVHGLSPLVILFPMAIGALAFSGLLGLAIERIAVHPLRRAPPLVFLITSVAVYLVIEQLVLVFYPNGANPQVFPDPFRLASFSIGDAVIGHVQVFVILISLVSIVALHLIITRTALGRAIRAVTADAVGARMLGINVDRTVAQTFMLGSALAGVGGIVEGLNFGSISFTMGFVAGIKGFTAAVIGGLGNVYGALAGGFLLGLLEVISSGYLPQGTAYKNVVTFGLLIACLLVRPHGLLTLKASARA
jgi:branched-chain amino acid transport system permease protein